MGTTNRVERTGLLVLVLGLGLAACGSDGRTAEERTEVVTWLVEQGETPTTAECLADDLADYRVDDFAALALVTDGDAFDEDFKADVDAAIEACNA